MDEEPMGPGLPTPSEAAGETDADTEAGRGEGLDALTAEDYEPHLRPAVYEAWGRHHTHDPDAAVIEQALERNHPEAEAARRAFGNLCRRFNRLRQSDPGGREWWNCPTCEREGDGSVISPPDALHCPMCGTRNPAAPTDEAPEGAVYATISCENPECGSRGPEPRKLYDGEVLDHCQVCCEETLVLRLRSTPQGEDGDGN